MDVSIGDCALPCCGLGQTVVMDLFHSGESLDRYITSSDAV
jgi:hypothetical protein